MTNTQHMLLIKNAEDPECSCGEVFKMTPAQALKAWQDHLEIPGLLENVSGLVQVERTARLESEIIMMRLLKLGLSTRAIADAIGTDKDGKHFVSTSVIQRLGRGEVEVPRRRYTKRVAVTGRVKKVAEKKPAKKAVAKKTTTKKG